MAHQLTAKVRSDVQVSIVHDVQVTTTYTSVHVNCTLILLSAAANVNTKHSKQLSGVSE